ncbi:MAG: carboxypeptidase-like regulatory domain-containing protein, partial [Aquaticitalea sp.]
MSIKIRIILFLCFLNSSTLLSQNTITLSGYIYDEETKASLPYVNIGFVNESVGTVSDDNGKFDLTFNPNEISNSSVLQISYIGYKTVELQASNFFAAIVKDNKFYLQPEPY